MVLLDSAPSLRDIARARAEVDDQDEEPSVMRDFRGQGNAKAASWEDGKRTRNALCGKRWITALSSYGIRVFASAVFF